MGLWFRPGIRPLPPQPFLAAPHPRAASALLLVVSTLMNKKTFRKVGVLTGVFVVVLAVNLLKGGGAFPSPLGIKCGSYAFWGATGFIFVWVLGVSL